MANTTHNQVMNDESEEDDLSVPRISAWKDSQVNAIRLSKNFVRCALVLNNMPIAILLYQLVPFLETVDLLRLSKITKTYYHNSLSNHSVVAWKAAAKRIFFEYREEQVERKFSHIPPCKYKTFVSLYSYIGCQICNKPRIRKVYAEFKVRCCVSCLHAYSISAYRLQTEYGLNPNTFELPCRTSELWHKRIGTYQVNFYWLDSVKQLVLQSRGITMEQLHQEFTQEKEQEEIERVAEERLERLTAAKKKRKEVADTEAPQRLLNKRRKLILKHVHSLESGRTYINDDILNRCSSLTSVVETMDRKWNKARDLLPLLQQLSAEYTTISDLEQAKAAQEAKRRAAESLLLQRQEDERRVIIAKENRVAHEQRLLQGRSVWQMELTQVHSPEASMLLENATETGTGRCYKCNHCAGSTRTFSKQGLSDHSRAKHPSMPVSCRLVV